MHAPGRGHLMGSSAGNTLELQNLRRKCVSCRRPALSSCREKAQNQQLHKVFRFEKGRKEPRSGATVCHTRRTAGKAGTRGPGCGCCGHPRKGLRKGAPPPGGTAVRVPVCTGSFPLAAIRTANLVSEIKTVAAFPPQSARFPAGADEQSSMEQPAWGPAWGSARTPPGLSSVACVTGAVLATLKTREWFGEATEPPGPQATARTSSAVGVRVPVLGPALRGRVAPGGLRASVLVFCF